MRRLIDANKLIDFIDVGHLRHSGELCYSEVDVANLLLHALTIDAVPVVRCAQCKHFKRNLENDTYCSSVYGLTDPQEDDFCSHGERRDDDDQA